MTIKQQIHNWIYGENSRQQNLTLHMRELSHERRSYVQGLGLVSPDVRLIWGPDTSHWDGDVNFAVTRERGGIFTFIKGLDGTVRTRYYATNRERAIAAGLLQAPYQWLYRDANVPCRAQAQAMDTLLDENPSALPSVIDFEWTRWMGQASNPNYADLDKYVTELLRLGRRKPILYSAAGYMNPFGRMPSALKEKFSAFWFANYGVSAPALPMGFIDWDFWQFTASGDALMYAPNAGGKLELDLNYWNGDLQELYALAEQIPPPETGGSMWYRATGNINIRQMGVTGAPAVTTGERYVLTNDIVEVEVVQGGFAKLLRLYRYDFRQELAPVAWCGTAYLRSTTYTPPDVEPPDPEPEPVTKTHTIEVYSDGTISIDGSTPA
jgi:lysozyme